MALWEESYAAYEKAVTYSPDDPRTINDCGLMLVYHLHRDTKRSRELLNRAIELGTAQLDELGAAEDDESEQLKSQRESLEEAVGDAYQNLGVLYRVELKQPKKSIPYYRKALDYWSPTNRRQIRGLLRNLEREHGTKKDDKRENGR